MSMFGAHISAGKRQGIGEALWNCDQAGSPVPVLFALNQDLWPDVRDKSPLTVLIFRTQINGNDYPPDIYYSDPVASAEAWYTACLEKWIANPAHYYAPTNERNPQKNDLAQLAWCDVFDLRIMQLADADGFKLALHGDSLGTPDYPDWQAYHASLAYAAQHGHILTLHEPVEGNSLAFRYRTVHDLIEPFAPGLKMVISECYGVGMGDWPLYVDSFKQYDLEAMNDAAYLIGFCAYQLGGDENWYTQIPRWAAWVSTHPTPEVEPPPPPPPPPPVVITEHFFTDIITQDDEAADDIDAILTLHGVPARHYKREIGV